MLQVSVNVLCTFYYAYFMLTLVNELCLLINMQLSLVTNGHRYDQESCKNL
jgi:hypothetical protein